MKISELLSQEISVRQSADMYVWKTRWTAGSWGTHQSETGAKCDAQSAVIRSAIEWAKDMEKRLEWQSQRIAELEEALKAAGVSVPDAVCPNCKRRVVNVQTRRLNTAYVDDDSNFMQSCEDCYQEAYSNYEEMWDDYYRNCM